MIVWLASYPKSGNTWLRVLLANYLSQAKVPVSINALGTLPWGSSRALLDATLELKTADATEEELPEWRAIAYRHLAAQTTDPLFLKVHDLYQPRLFPPEATFGVIYLVRDPHDVAVSFAHHSNASLARVTGWMADPGYRLAQGNRGLQVPELVGSWSGHVESWLAAELRVLVIRYEDLLAHPHQTFGSALEFLNQPREEQRVARAIEFSTFDRLQAQEQADGFREGPHRSGSFFRSGRAGHGRNHLDEAQRELLEREHGQTMARFGYLVPKP
ncbi:MAG: sulfotransferase domain-containing protein [Vulcanimicrobiota bacterium]